MIHRRRPAPTLALAAFAALAACDRPDTPVAPDPGMAAQAAARQDGPGIDGEFARLARTIPGFGGYYFDEKGDLVVVLTDARQAPAARAALASVAARGAGRAGAASAEIRVQPGTYDFARLDGWRRRVAPLLALDGVAFLDTDEVANRVRIGVLSDAAAARVRTEVARLNVPAAAVDVDVVPPVEPIATLRDQVRPVKAGLEIVRGSDQGQCTLGFNAYYVNWALNIPPGTRAFLTAAHCTNQPGVVEGTTFSQGGAYIGHEIADPAPFTSASNTRCPAGLFCRNSDVAVIGLDAGTSWSLGYIARTDAMGFGPYQSGSITLTSPDIRIGYTNADFPAVGTRMDKVGRTTGWTAGNVLATCVDVRDYWVFICQNEVGAYGWHGDSGSGIFRWVDGSVALAGIIWAHNSAGGIYYSPLGQIQDDIGTFTPF